MRFKPEKALREAARRECSPPLGSFLKVGELRAEEPT